VADNGTVSDGWVRDETLYSGSASHYATGRLPYPAALGERICAASGLGQLARGLDVGCGPGSLTLLLAGHLGHVVGVDADGDMLVEADLAADRMGVGNVSWRRMLAEQMPADLGRFDLVTFAQSFHWMQRLKVARIVRKMLTSGGCCVHVHATTARGDDGPDPLPHPRPPYAEIEALVRTYLGPASRAGTGSRPTFEARSEDGIYRQAGFEGPEEPTVRRGEVVVRSEDEIVAATFSLSSSTPYLFADREEFEADLGSLLARASTDGLFAEQARDVEFDVWRAGRDTATASSRP
jgi:SAM-dependent methyltransferase